MVSGSVSLSCSEYFSPFPHGTGSLSVSQEYLALPDGAGGFTQDFSGPVLLRIRHRWYADFIYRPVTFYGGVFQAPSTIVVPSVSAVLQPWKGLNLSSLGSSPFARHYLGNHVCFLFHRLLRCFSWPGLPPEQVRDTISSIWWVAPLGDLRMDGYLHLPEAYRSLSRPSSPLRAKASAMRSCLLSYPQCVKCTLSIPRCQRTFPFIPAKAGSGGKYRS